MCDLILRAHDVTQGDDEQDAAGEPVEVELHAVVAAAMSPTIETMLGGQFRESRRDAPIELPPDSGVDAALLRSVVNVSLLSPSSHPAPSSLLPSRWSTCTPGSWSCLRTP